MPLNFLTKTALAVALSFGAAALGSCGVDDVQLNGKIFDAMGMNSTGSVSKSDPKVAQRQPLVIPPGLESLPAPGSGDNSQTALAAIQDPDKKANLSKAELQRQQEEYCQKNYTDALARGDETAHLAEGPMGRCQGSIFSAVKQWTKNDDGDDNDSTAQ